MFSPNVRKYGPEKTPYLGTFERNELFSDSTNITINTNVKGIFTIRINKSKNQQQQSKRVIEV